jgi:hypothetical protein
MRTPIGAALLMYGLAAAIGFGVAALIRTLSVAVHLLGRRREAPTLGPRMP